LDIVSVTHLSSRRVDPPIPTLYFGAVSVTARGLSSLITLLGLAHIPVPADVGVGGAVVETPIAGVTIGPIVTLFLGLHHPISAFWCPVIIIVVIIV